MSRRIATGLLAVVLFAAYANHFQNSFHFDGTRPRGAEIIRLTLQLSGRPA